MAVQSPEHRPKQFVSSGLPGLDSILEGLRIGDNVVWRVDSIDDYRAFVAPYVAAARGAGRRVAYIRFASHAPVVEPDAVSAVYNLDAHRGFESFTVHLHTIISNEGAEVFYVFDCLSDLLDAWATDSMVGNFFRVTCPYLFDLRTVAYFALERHAHSFATIDRIRATTQLLLDLYNKEGVLYLHPLKVWQRSSPTMFLPHRHAGGQFTPITVSCEATSLFMGLRGSAAGDLERHLDSWERLFIHAADLDASAAPAGERQAMVEQLCRLLIGRDERILALARRHFTLEDLLEIKERLIGTGFVGGKSVGMLLARAILRSDADGQWDEVLEPHDSFFIGSDLFHSFIVNNGWWQLFMWQRSEAGYLNGAEQLRELFLQGNFSVEIQLEFQKMLEYFGQCPIIVRSSSLLEDGFGNAFAGKYDSFFCVNQGSPEERLEQFMHAVRQVYSSTLSEEALQYRLQRGLARQEEQMALLVQRVSGAYHGKLFFPALAGVGVSYNTFVWRHDIDPAAGMLRLVVGLGTRAVDRVEGDYPRIVSLDKPLLVPYADSEDKRRFTQRDIDVLDVAQNGWVTIPINQLEAEEPTLPLELFAEYKDRSWLFTFERLLTQTSFTATMRRLLATLERAYEYPVDVEFTGTYASNGQLYLNLIQCRPLQTRGIQSKRVEIRENYAAETLFRSTGSFMGGSIAQPIARVIAVDSQAFTGLTLSDKYELARIIGRLNRFIKARDPLPSLLLGPGRWGTSTPRLGVPVRFAEIDGMTAIAEVAFSAGGLQPELSFGTHFFQDLVETGIFYVALNPEKQGCLINTAMLMALPNRLAELLPDDARFAETLRVVDLPPGYQLLADIMSQQVVCARAPDLA
ncbi:MAG: PEP/pyruvate-binding domain-containing protein [Burkholderiales bacterium]|nr:PEP/pyruvate-binding domain-containing protein [Burkholderiales bacterium]